jgi:hypothetical protein
MASTPWLRLLQAQVAQVDSCGVVTVAPLVLEPTATRHRLKLLAKLLVEQQVLVVLVHVPTTAHVMATDLFCKVEMQLLHTVVQVVVAVITAVAQELEMVAAQEDPLGGILRKSLQQIINLVFDVEME